MFMGIPDGIGSNVMHDRVGTTEPVRAPSPGKPSVFQKTWEDSKNGTGPMGSSAPVTLRLGDLIEGLRHLFRNLPEVQQSKHRMGGGGGFGDTGDLMLDYGEVEGDEEDAGEGEDTYGYDLEDP
jgi:hypothetical protein